MAAQQKIFITKTIAEFKTWRNHTKGTVGFIPTMGYLHAGHISLIKLARVQNEHVVVSIFVNPKQFGTREDFKFYPRNEKHDIALLKKYNVEVVFLPKIDEMYPSNYETVVSVANLSKKLEGKSRPGHFDGVSTVIAKLFNIVQPHIAYFGQKDAQQIIIVKKLVKDLNYPISIIVGKTIRQKDGLALSSRNAFLTKSEKKQSTVLARSLLKAQDLVRKGERNPIKIKKALRHLIKQTSGKIDYISIADPLSLNEVTTLQNKVIVSMAIYFGKTRLIDNCILTI